ncbi:MAG: alpha/beta hydrolase [Flavobacteriaceae bacterium]|tara:strand:+ start:272 stop:1099 length:828 start_codon:yes stop_codon:yes gene_type:complete
MSKYIPKIIGGFINFISLFSTTSASKIAIYIFSKPRKGGIDAEEKEFLETADKKVVFYNDIGIQTYQWIGNKPTVLLIHGWESNSYRWKDLIELLKSEDYNIISIDAPAHGNSGSKMFNAILYSECINVVINQFNIHTVIGHSVGGTAIAIALHNYNISSVKKLISLGAPSNFIALSKTYRKMMGFNKRVKKAMDSYYLQEFGHLPEYFTVANYSKNILAKGLIIHDRKDRIIPYKDAIEIARHYKNSKLIKTVGFGHGLKSEIVYNHILEFLND